MTSKTEVMEHLSLAEPRTVMDVLIRLKLDPSDRVIRREIRQLLYDLEADGEVGVKYNRLNRKIPMKFFKEPV